MYSMENAAENILFYLFVNYNTITNYILTIYELSNFDHVLGVVSQTEFLMEIKRTTLTLIAYHTTH